MKLFHFPSPKTRLLLVVVHEHDSDVWLRKGWRWMSLGRFLMNVVKSEEKVVGLQLSIKEDL